MSVSVSSGSASLTMSAADSSEEDVWPSALAGMLPGDLITEIPGSPAHSPDQVVVITLGRSPGDTVTLTYRRGDATHTADLTLAAP